MRKVTAWLPIAAGVLIVPAAATGLGRYGSNVGTPVGSASAAVHGEATDNVSGFDTSPHKTITVTVAPDVQLEVLDWGGTGEPMVLLTGAGDNAHAYDQFAFQFTDRFHVIGITRRGFGRSSQPADGYDLDTRARDDIAVLDKLNIRKAVFVGHLVAGTELSKLVTAYADRVGKLVYLDALDIGSGGWGSHPPATACPGVHGFGPRIGATSFRSHGA